MYSRETYKVLPKEPAKPLNGNIVIKRVVQKPTKEQLQEKPKKDKREREIPLDPILLYQYTTVHDVGEHTELPFKAGDKVNIVCYGNEVITAEELTETEDISYAIVAPNQVIGLYTL